MTLNPPTPPAAERTIKRLTLSHPVFGAGACEAQEALPSIQARSVCYVAPYFRLVSNPQAHVGYTYLPPPKVQVGVNLPEVCLRHLHKL